MDWSRCCQAQLSTFEHSTPSVRKMRDGDDREMRDCDYRKMRDCDVREMRDCDVRAPTINSKR
jgi:hypothetical protein